MSKKKSKKKKNSEQKIINDEKNQSSKKQNQDLKKAEQQKPHQDANKQAPVQRLEIPLKEKIKLEKSSHSYKTYLQRKYGHHLKNSAKPLLLILKIVGVAFFLLALFVLTVYLFFGRDLPDVTKLKSMDFAETTRIYDREGNVLYSIYAQENRKYIPLKAIAKDAVNATVAIEDKNFYRHWGFDIVGMIRAQLKNLKDDGIKQGASTITQQLAKNIFLSSERTYERKIKELLISLEIEVLFSKDEILEMYLNKIAYGSNAFGIEAASQTFFKKSAKDLTLTEASILASLPKAPSTYSPYGPNKKDLLGYCKSNQSDQITIQDNEEPENISTQELKVPDLKLSTQEILVEQQKPLCVSMDDSNYVWGRKDYVLERMFEDGYITKEQMSKAWADSLKIKFADPIHKIESPHFVFYVKEWLEQRYGKELVESGGLEVKTSLDPRLQSIAEDAIAKHAQKNADYGADNAGLTALDPKTGQILAMVGSEDYWNEKIDGQVNITTSPRQPGSAFKPLVYAAAIANSGIGSGTVLGDYKTVFNKKDVPQDYDGQFLGRITIRQALGGSRNIPAIKAYYVAGEEDKVLDFVDKLGVKDLRAFKDEFNSKAAEHGWTFNYGWPMAIGSGEVPLINLVSAYSVFANQGRRNEINPILEVRNRDGEIIDKFDQPKNEQVIDPQVAYIITDMLADVSVRPAGSWRNLLTIPGQNVAAKTGTSNKRIGSVSVPNNDMTVGYTPSLAVGVWVGNTDGKNLRSNAYSLYTSDPIWHDFFAEALKDKPKEDFPVPEGIKHVGREVYPSFSVTKNWDKMFKRLDSQETQDTTAFPQSALVTNPSKPKTITKEPQPSSGAPAGQPKNPPAVAVPKPAEPAALQPSSSIAGGP